MSIGTKWFIGALNTSLFFIVVCTTELDIYENARPTGPGQRQQARSNAILKHDCLERLNDVHPTAHSAVYDDETNTCFFYQGYALILSVKVNSTSRGPWFESR